MVPVVLHVRREEAHVQTARRARGLALLLRRARGALAALPAQAQNPDVLPGNVSVDYSPLAEQARLIQSAYRRLLRDRAQAMQRAIRALVRGRPRADVLARRQIRRRR